jgi:hypothetical protein
MVVVRIWRKALKETMKRVSEDNQHTVGGPVSGTPEYKAKEIIAQRIGSVQACNSTLLMDCLVYFQNR